MTISELVPAFLALGKWRQEDYEFRARPCYRPNLKITKKPGMAVCPCNFSTQESERGRSLSSRPARAVQ